MHALFRSALLASLIAPLFAGTVDIRLVSFNDFHGNLRPPMMGLTLPDTEGKPQRIKAGGAEYLSAWIKHLKAGHAHTAVVAAGDLIGASPLLSSMFHDEASIEALSIMGLEYASVGNHEFDAGTDELRRMQNGGCHPGDDCSTRPFNGASFKYLAANVIERKTGQTFFPGYAIKTFDKTPVAFIGMTLKGTAEIITPLSSQYVEFKDEVNTVNALVPELKKQGVGTIVVLVHEGGRQGKDAGINGCGQFTGPIVKIAEQLDPAVSVIVSGHTHEYYNCKLSGKLVTSAYSYSRMVTAIDMQLDSDTGKTLSAEAKNHIVTTDIAADPAETALIERYEAIVKPLEEKVIGKLKGRLNNQNDEHGSTPMGNVVAEAYLDSVRNDTFGNPVIGLVNHGSVRTDMTPAENGNVTYGQAYSVQPFRNNIMVMDLSGEELVALLEQQFEGRAGMLQVSRGLTYTYNRKAEKGQHVDRASIRIAGKAFDPKATYRIVVNNFMAQGGDGFTVLRQGRNVQTSGLDVDALVSYLGKHEVDPADFDAQVTRADR
ncbi:bifunctional metallophosphatase/5'-nucleotidase [Burkholderiaceae bacterium DAT-1]|nr:bifunctional metallophosphatase/5'-nucleotidase [Burkholderiaceae bacterium DAT-1]